MKIEDVPWPELLALEAFDRLNGIAPVAREASISIPAISKRLDSLQNDLGAELLQRHSRDRRRLKLTNEGKALVDAVRRALPAVEKLAEEMSAISQR